MSVRLLKCYPALPVPDSNCCGYLHHCCCCSDYWTASAASVSFCLHSQSPAGPLGSQSVHGMGILAGISHRERPSLSLGCLEHFCAVCSSFYPSFQLSVPLSIFLHTHPPTSPARQLSICSSSCPFLHPSVHLSSCPFLHPPLTRLLSLFFGVRFCLFFFRMLYK